MRIARKYDFSKLHPGLNQTFDDIMTMIKNIDKDNFTTIVDMAGVTLQNVLADFADTQTFESSKFLVDADIDMDSHKLTDLSVPVNAGDSIRATASITEANLEDAISKKHTQNTDTQLGTTHIVTGEKLIEYDEYCCFENNILCYDNEPVYLFA